MKKIQVPLVMDMDERGRCDSVTAFNKVQTNIGGFNETSKPFVSPGTSPAFVAQPLFGQVNGVPVGYG